MYDHPLEAALELKLVLEFLNFDVCDGAQPVGPDGLVCVQRAEGAPPATLVQILYHFVDL